MPVATRSPQPAKALLALRDRTVRDVARELDVSAHYLGRVLNGLVRPSQRLTERLAAILDVEPAELFCDDGDVVVQLVRRTTTASGVPERVEDTGTAAQVAIALEAS